jgi:hypothetical protein
MMRRAILAMRAPVSIGSRRSFDATSPTSACYEL